MTQDTPAKVADRARRFFRVWATIVVGSPRLAIGSSVAMSAFLGLSALLFLQVNNSTEGLLGSDSPEMLVLDEMARDFGTDKSFVLVVTGDVFSERFLGKLERLHRELEALELALPTLGLERSERNASFRGRLARGNVEADRVAEEVTSLVNVRDPRFTDEGLAVGGLLDTLPTGRAELEEVRRKALASPTWVGWVVDARGRIALVHMRLRAMSEADAGLVRDALDEIVARYHGPDFRVRTSGHAAFEVSLNRTMQRDIILVIIAEFVLMGGVLFYLFRSGFGVFGPMAVIAMSQAAALGAMALCNAPMTGVTSVLGGFLLIIGLANVVHVQTTYRELREKGLPNEEAIVEGVAEAAWPITFTALTDVVGLLSFRTSELQAVSDLGTYASVGIGAALVHALVFLPAFLTYDTRLARDAAKTKAHAPDLLDKFLVYCEAASRPVWRNGRASNHRRNRVLLATALLTGLAGFGAAQIQAVQDPLAWLPEWDENRRMVRFVEEHLGGATNAVLVVQAAPGRSLRERDFLERLERLERHVLAYRDPVDGQPLATHALSILDVVRETWQTIHDGDPAFRVLPDTDQGVSDCLTLIESSGPRELSRLVTADLARTKLGVRLRWREASAYGPFRAHVAEGVRRHLGDAATVQITGTAMANYAVVTSLSDDLLESFGTAFLGIAVTMILVVWSVKLGLLSLIPNVLPILMMAGLMGALQVPLDLMSLLVGSIAMGLVVDDTIHVLHYYVTRKDELGNERAVRSIFQATGRAVVTTSVTLVAGFSLYLFVTMINVQRFGGLLAATILVAVFGDLLVTPAILRTLGKCEPLPEDGPARDAAAGDSAGAVAEMT